MRVTPSIQNRNFLENVNQLKTRLDKAQEEVSSGKTVNRLSDNPFAASQASNLTSMIGANDQFTAMNDRLKGKLEVTDTVLQSMIRNLDSAQALATQALSGTTTPEARNALAGDVEGIRKQMLSAGNTQLNGSYIFAGTMTTAAPFVDTAGVVTYNGNDEAMYQRLDRSVVVQTNITGQDLFLGAPPMFTVLSDLKNAILANDTTTIQARLNDLQSISDRVNDIDSTVGNNMKLVDQLQDSLRANSQALQDHISTLTDADLAKSITDMNLTNQSINMSLNAQANVQQLSLLDYLR
jgi:flagellar hook-associated protein 3 FlgL